MCAGCVCPSFFPLPHSLGKCESLFIYLMYYLWYHALSWPFGCLMAAAAISFSNSFPPFFSLATPPPSPNFPSFPPAPHRCCCLALSTLALWLALYGFAGQTKGVQGEELECSKSPCRPGSLCSCAKQVLQSKEREMCRKEPYLHVASGKLLPRGPPSIAPTISTAPLSTQSEADTQHIATHPEARSLFLTYRCCGHLPASLTLSNGHWCAVLWLSFLPRPQPVLPSVSFLYLKHTSGSAALFFLLAIALATRSGPHPFATKLGIFFCQSGDAS